MQIKAELPKLLAERGWKVLLDQRETNHSFALGPGASRDVVVELKPGGDFTAQEIKQARGGQIRLTVLADGDVIGGMTYDLDHTLQRAPAERIGVQPISLNDPEIEEAIRNTQEGDGESVPVEIEPSENGGSVPTKDNGTAEWLLSQLGLAGELSGKINRVTVRKVLLELDLAD